MARGSENVMRLNKLTSVIKPIFRGVVIVFFLFYCFGFALNDTISWIGRFYMLAIGLVVLIAFSRTFINDFIKLGVWLRGR